MVVLIPHPTEELKLVTLRKELLSQNLLNFVPLYPFWIPLPQELTEKYPTINKESLKQISTKLIKVELQKPEINNSTLEIPVVFTTENNTFTTNLAFAKELENLNSKKKSSQNILAGFSEKFPMNLKIFKIGNGIQNEELHCFRLEDFIWKKLK